MGSYINVGLICDKGDFKEKVVKLIQSLEGFCCKRIDYPADENYSDWVEVPGEQNQIFKNLDVTEAVIISFLKELSSLEFSKVFADGCCEDKY